MSENKHEVITRGLESPLFYCFTKQFAEEISDLMLGPNALLVSSQINDTVSHAALPGGLLSELVPIPVDEFTPNKPPKLASYALTLQAAPQDSLPVDGAEYVWQTSRFDAKGGIIAQYRVGQRATSLWRADYDAQLVRRKVQRLEMVDEDCHALCLEAAVNGELMKEKITDLRDKKLKQQAELEAFEQNPVTENSFRIKVKGSKEEKEIKTQSRLTGEALKEALNKRKERIKKIGFLSQKQIAVVTKEDLTRLLTLDLAAG